MILLSLSIYNILFNIIVVNASEQKLLARYSTNYDINNVERSSNIEVASSAINGIIARQNTIISFNELTGERNEENGYKKSKVIENGEYVEGIGGGVCQVSTTLYNALLIAGFHIIKVRGHSLKPSYVPPSMDAMVSNGDSDLVFSNIYKNALTIYASAKNGTITVDVFGDVLKVDHKLRFEVCGEIEPPPPLIVADVNGKYKDKVIFEEETFVLVEEKSGIKSKLYSTCGGKETLLRIDNYLPTRGVHIKGTL